MYEESSQSLASFLVPVLTIGLVVFVQVNFGLTAAPDKTTDQVEVEQEYDGVVTQAIRATTEQAGKKAVDQEPTNDDTDDVVSQESTNEDAPKNSLNDNDSPSKAENATTTNTDPEDLLQGFNQWRCVCEEGSFLPPALLKTFGPAEAMVRLGTGQCYHKQM